jgi:hypothetical protein
MNVITAGGDTAAIEKENMITFTIDTDSNITAFATLKEAEAGNAKEMQVFGSEKEMVELASRLPMSRLVDMWNSIPGVTPVKKFTDRKKAGARIWKAVQQLKPATATQTSDVAPAKARPAKKAKTTKATPTARDGSKKAKVITLLQQSGGATLKQIMAATDWQAHSVRGFLSGALTKKMGLAIESTKNETGERSYQIAK